MPSAITYCLQNKEVLPVIAANKNIEQVPSLPNGRTKGNFVTEETYNYYPADYLHPRRAHYGPVAFPNYQPHSNNYPFYNPHLYARDPYFRDGYDAYDRRIFNNF